MRILIESLLGDATCGQIKKIVTLQLYLSGGTEKLTNGEGGMTWLIGTGGLSRCWGDGAVRV
jgi:hypothetical protein